LNQSEGDSVAATFFLWAMFIPHFPICRVGKADSIGCWSGILGERYDGSVGLELNVVNSEGLPLFKDKLSVLPDGWS
jgi:hypothetical protein